MYSKDQFPRQNCFRYHFSHVRWGVGRLCLHAFIGCLIGIIVPIWTVFIFVPSKIIIATKYLSTILAVHTCRSGSLQMTKKLAYSLIYTKRICRTHRPHIDRPHIHPTSNQHPPHIHPTSTLHPPHIHPTSTLHPPHVDPRQKNINVSKHFILGHLCLSIPSVKMRYKHKRDCPVCDKPGLRYMSNHVRQVHHLYGNERNMWLGRARFSISHKHCSGLLPGTYNLKEMRYVRKKTCSVLKPTKTARKVTASMLTKPYADFNFRHKFSLLVVGPTQSGKTYFVQ